jgi:hypothetical protein
LRYKIEAWLGLAIKQFVRHLADGRLVGKFEGLGAKPLHTDDHDQAVWK